MRRDGIASHGSGGGGARRGARRGLAAHPGRRRRSGRSPIVLHLAPMIDVTFLLLIFFLVSTRFGQAEGVLASQMPHQGQGQSVALPMSPLVVRIHQVGPDLDDFEILIDHFTEVPRSFGELATYLREIQAQPGFDAETPVVLMPQPDVAWDHVVNAWNAALRAGYRTVAFGNS
jgi:biopolymer transport protein ExbD